MTLHPDDDVRSPEATRAEAAERVRARVQGFADDALADARAAGAINPYFEALGHALEAGLASADGGTPVQLGISDGNAGLKKSYAAAAAAYGHGGDPGLAPPGRVPTHSEQLRDREAPLLARLGAQAAETTEGLAQRTPLLSLTLELRQTPQGALLEARIVEGSGNVRFDAFVARVVPDALLQVTAPPPTRPSGLRSVFQVDGWLQRRPSVLEQLERSVTPLALIAPFVDQVAVTDPAAADFDFRATLLRAY